MAIFGLFKSKSFDPEQFEKQLTQLTQNISKVQRQTTQLKKKQASVAHTVLLILISAYILILALTYQNVPKDIIGGHGRLYNYIRVQSTKTLVLLVLFPGFSYLIMFLSNWLFQFWIKRRQEYLKSLKEDHKEKINELKRITNFNKTNYLLNRYGEEDVKQNDQTKTPKSKKQPPKVNRQTKSGENPGQGYPGQISSPNFQTNSHQLNSQVNSQNNIPNQPTPVRPASPTHRTFQDRILDYIIGSDHNESVETRFALICSKCYTHNGLAPPGCENPLEVQYVCPRCGFINGSEKVQESQERLDVKPGSTSGSKPESISGSKPGSEPGSEPGSRSGSTSGSAEIVN